MWQTSFKSAQKFMVNFVVRIIEFKKQLQFDSLMVAYSAFYTQENIQIVDKLKWLSGLPLTVKAATLLAKSVENKDLITSQIPGSNYIEIKPNYAAVEQRWLLVESNKRKESDLKKLSKKIQKDKEACKKKLR